MRHTEEGIQYLYNIIALHAGRKKYIGGTMAAAKLRPLCMGDLDNIMQWLNNPEIVSHIQAFKLPISRDTEKAHLEKIIASTSDKVFSIETEEEIYIGQIGIHQIHWPSRIGRLGLIIGKKEYQGRGYGQGAVKEASKFAFESLGLNKLWLMVYATNERGLHMYDKCGFQKEGVLRQEYFHQGKFHDMVRMAFLAENYFAGKAGKE